MEMRRAISGTVLGKEKSELLDNSNLFVGLTGTLSSFIDLSTLASQVSVIGTLGWRVDSAEWHRPRNRRIPIVILKIKKKTVCDEMPD